MSEEAVEQITKTPILENKSAKLKDPKKVAAGKRLAEHNKRAKEALKEKMDRDAEKATKDSLSEETTSASTSQSLIPNLSLTTVLSVVGLGLTAFDMFMRYKKSSNGDIQMKRLSEADRVKLRDERLQETSTGVEPLSSKNPLPKNQKMIGML